MTDDLSTWLDERIVEDVRVARDADPTLDGIADSWFTADGDIRFIQHFTSARVLAECEAKRKVIDLHTLPEDAELPHGHWEGYGSDEVWVRDEPNVCPVCNESEPCTTVRLLAVPFAEHPGYRPEWKP